MLNCSFCKYYKHINEQAYFCLKKNARFVILGEKLPDNPERWCNDFIHKQVLKRLKFKIKQMIINMKKKGGSLNK